MLIHVEWSAINFKDAMVTRPGNRVARTFPLVPGVELAGVVEESTSDEFTPGQRVLVQGYELGVSHHGGFAAYARVPADWVVPLPDSLSCRNAAIIGLAGYTALLSLNRLLRHGTAPDDGPVLVTGASGGVGSAAVALVANAGFEVVASSGKSTEHDYLKELGASRVVGREFTEDDGRTLGPQLWGGVVDCVGGMALAEALRTVRYGGAVAASGLTGGNNLATTVYPFIIRGVSLLGIDTVATPIEERRTLWADMAECLPARALRGDGARGDRPRRAHRRPRPGARCRRTRPRPRHARTLGLTGPRPADRPTVSRSWRTPATRRPSRCCTAPSSGGRSGSSRPRWAASPTPPSDSGQLVCAPVGTSEYW